MKKTIMILAAALAAFTFASCEKNEAEPAGKNIKVNITVASPEGPDTKAIKSGWAAGDKINIWFDEYITVEPNMILTYDGAKWNAGALTEGVALKESGKIKALYEGYNDWSKYTKSDRTTWDDPYIYANISGDHFPACWITTQRITSAVYSYDGETLTGTIPQWETCSCFQVVITGEDLPSAANCQLKCDRMYALGGFTIREGWLNQSTGNTNTYVGGVDNADGVAFYFNTLSNSVNGVAANYTFTLTDTSDNTEKTYTVTGKTLSYDLTKIQGIKIDYSKFE